MPARVFGIVYNAADGTPIANCTVVAPPYPVTLAGNGSYYFLTPGGANVDVTASAPNFNPQVKNVTIGDGGLKRVDFNLTHI